MLLRLSDTNLYINLIVVCLLLTVWFSHTNRHVSKGDNLWCTINTQAKTSQRPSSLNLTATTQALQVSAPLSTRSPPPSPIILMLLWEFWEFILTILYRCVVFWLCFQLQLYKYMSNFFGVNCLPVAILKIKLFKLGLDFNLKVII